MEVDSTPQKVLDFSLFLPSINWAVALIARLCALDTEPREKAIFTDKSV